MKSKKGFADLVLVFCLAFGLMVVYGDKDSKSTMDYLDRTSSSPQVNEGYNNPNLTYEQFKEQLANGTLPEKGTKMTVKFYSQMTDEEKLAYDKWDKSR
jgi:hypothetical protein